MIQGVEEKSGDAKIRGDAGIQVEAIVQNQKKKGKTAQKLRESEKFERKIPKESDNLTSRFGQGGKKRKKRGCRWREAEKRGFWRPMISPNRVRRSSPHFSFFGFFSFGLDFNARVKWDPRLLRIEPIQQLRELHRLAIRVWKEKQLLPALFVPVRRPRLVVYSAALVMDDHQRFADGIGC